MKKLVADEGYVFVRKDRTAVYDNLLFLSDIDSEDNYEEMLITDAAELKQKLEDTAYAENR